MIVCLLGGVVSRRLVHNFLVKVSAMRSSRLASGFSSLGSVLLAVTMFVPAAWAQAPAPAAGPPPSVAEALAFVNEALAANPSPWRPCRSTAQLELEADGTLSVVISRDSYCEDSKIFATVRDLDPANISWEATDEIVVRLPCLEEGTCARHLQRRKINRSGTWETRDEVWIPDGPLGQEHMVTAIELPMMSKPEKAAQVASALKFLVNAARLDPTYAIPPDRFGQEPAAPAGASGT